MLVDLLTGVLGNEPPKEHSPQARIPQAASQELKWAWWWLLREVGPHTMIPDPGRGLKAPPPNCPQLAPGICQHPAGSSVPGATQETGTLAPCPVWPGTIRAALLKPPLPQKTRRRVLMVPTAWAGRKCARSPGPVSHLCTVALSPLSPCWVKGLQKTDLGAQEGQRGSFWPFQCLAGMTLSRDSSVGVEGVGGAFTPGLRAGCVLAAA